MIVLVTGQPGSGKTLLAVDMLAHDPQFSGRPLVVMGIPDLALDYDQCPPVEQWVEYRESPEDSTIQLPYFRFPENAVVVIDEAQRVFRPRAASAVVPPHVAAFETHRHVGIDFVLITQQAGLIDSNIRKLIGRHIHIKPTAIGRYRYEWLELGDPENATSRSVAARSRYTLPARSFGLYKSSELHTKIKARVPFYLWLIPGAVVVLFVIGYILYGRFTNMIDGKQTEELAQVPEPPPSYASKPSTSPGVPASPQTVYEYLAERMPRLEGVPSSAPRYDELTRPTRAPYVVGCYQIIEPIEVCRCVDDAGARMDVTEALCVQYMEYGIPRRDWASPEPHSVPANTVLASRQTPHGAQTRQGIVE